MYLSSPLQWCGILWSSSPDPGLSTSRRRLWHSTPDLPTDLWRRTPPWHLDHLGTLPGIWSCGLPRGCWASGSGNRLDHASDRGWVGGGSSHQLLLYYCTPTHNTKSQLSSQIMWFCSKSPDPITQNYLWPNHTISGLCYITLAPPTRSSCVNFHGSSST